LDADRVQSRQAHNLKATGQTRRFKSSPRNQRQFIHTPTNTPTAANGLGVLHLSRLLHQTPPQPGSHDVPRFPRRHDERREFESADWARWADFPPTAAARRCKLRRMKPPAIIFPSVQHHQRAEPCVARTEWLAMHKRVKFAFQTRSW